MPPVTSVFSWCSGDVFTPAQSGPRRRLSRLGGLLVVALLVALAVVPGSALAYPTLLETLTVSNTSATGVTTAETLVPGHTYRLVAYGEVSDWTSDPSGVYGGQAWGVDPLYCYATWRCATPELWRQLQITDSRSSTSKGLDEWGSQAGAIPYSSSHTYQAEASGISGKLTLVPNDTSMSDNSGQWTVELWDLGGHDVNISFKLRSYSNDVRARAPWQLGVSYFKGNGRMSAAGASGRTSTINHPTFYPTNSMSTRVESYTFKRTGVRKVLVLKVVVVASSSSRNCVVGTRGTVTLVDDPRRLKNGQTRDSFTQIYPQATCPTFVQGTNNRNHAHTDPAAGGYPGGGQWAVVTIRTQV